MVAWWMELALERLAKTPPEELEDFLAQVEPRLSNDQFRALLRVCIRGNDRRWPGRTKVSVSQT